MPRSRYPARGTIRDPVTARRRAMLRFFACEQDLSNESRRATPEAVAAGTSRSDCGAPRGVAGKVTDLWVPVLLAGRWLRKYPRLMQHIHEGRLFAGRTSSGCRRWPPLSALCLRVAVALQALIGFFTNPSITALSLEFIESPADRAVASAWWRSSYPCRRAHHHSWHVMARSALRARHS